MRVALALAAMALAACRVGVEGAPCDRPGSAEQCPSGQACGNDGKCSERAAACLESRCEPDATRCAGVGGREFVERCTTTDAACGAWEASPCTAIGLICDASDAPATCVAVPCEQPGASEECPAGQACGNDLACSAQAADCTERCVPGTTRCADADGLETCTTADAACGAWEATSCGASGLRCDASDHPAACTAIPCDTPGSDAVCPAGQACGNDLTCSARALECLATRCAPGATRCAGTVAVETCTTDEDAVCGTWTVATPCLARSLVCATSAAGAACACAAASSLDLYVDAGEGGSDLNLDPSGAHSPPECRLPSISAALSLAQPGSTVHVLGAPATYAELPLVIQRGVSLVAGDTPFDPASRVLANPVTAGAGLVLEEGARLAGFTVRATAGDARPLAIAVDCGGSDKVTLERIRVDTEIGATLSRGIELRGACDVDLLDVEISGAERTGLDVGLAPETRVARVSGGRVQSCETGITLASGHLRLEGTTIADNAGTGVWAGDGLQDTQLTATDALFSGNGDTALVLIGNARVDLQRNRICGNGAVTSRLGGRRVGGIFAQGAPPAAGALVFKGNEVHHNTADQVSVSGTPLTWNLDGGTDQAACAADRNLFLGYDADTGRGVTATAASVSARWNGWAGFTPTLGSDFEAFSGGTVDAGVGGQFCLPVPLPRPCP